METITKYLFSILIAFSIVASHAGAASLSFSPAQVIGKGCSPRLADLDGDGDLDVVAIKNVGVMGPSYQPIWLENKGTTWTEHVLIDWECGQMLIVPADLNGDGNMDLIISSSSIFKYTPGITLDAWLENDGAHPPHFIPHSLFKGPAGCGINGISTSDIDCDGDLDVAVGFVSYPIHDNSGIVLWYENDGGHPPLFTSHTLAAATDIMLNDMFSFADVNGDGWPDLLMGSWNLGTLMFRNPGNKTQPFVQSQISKYIGQICPADLNGDGRIDVPIGYAWCQNLGGEPASFATRLLIPNFTLSDYDCGNLALGDLNHDGTQDAVLYHPKGLAPYGYDLYALLNDGRLSPTLTMSRIGSYHVTPVIGDIDNDGNADIICNDGSRGLVLYRNQASLQPVAVLAPNDTGRTYASGRKMTIHWRTDVAVAGKQVVLELWRGTKTKVAWLANSTNDQGRGSITVTLPPVPAGSDYRIRAVSASNRALADFSDEPFAVYEPPRSGAKSDFLLYR